MPAYKGDWIGTRSVHGHFTKTPFSLSGKSEIEQWRPQKPSLGDLHLRRICGFEFSGNKNLIPCTCTVN